MSGPSGSAGAGEGLLEEKVDLSAETEAKLSEARSLYESNPSANLDAALAVLYGMEKKCRTNNDVASLVKVCEAAIKLCYESQQIDALISTLQALATRRSQKSAAVKAMVTQCLPWCMNVDKQAPLDPSEVVGGGAGQVFRDKLVVALRDLSDGKLYLERERAILTRVLATVKVRSSTAKGGAPGIDLAFV
jgi:26S proteasome regulatory subunit N5